jgi:hypothetical protein
MILLHIEKNKLNMFLNIITPCSRPENLIRISESINIPNENYRWIVVCDSESLPNDDFIPDNCEIYHHKDLNSISGNGQRNYALKMVQKGYVYFNDDDTTIHPELWENIKNLNNDFISFSQLNNNGTLRLIGDIIRVGHIDSHNFIVSHNLVGDTIFNLEKYDADGYFAIECREKSKSPIFINKPLSIYNQLR